ncbi:MAG: hypothetical protein V7L23_20155, partial [Nostoc sp.]|uniref:hypothetical protein n=1 Tax=Nostoc sp. TaxID=1180 RepID=UPI002FF4073E
EVKKFLAGGGIVIFNRLCIYIMQLKCRLAYSAIVKRLAVVRLITTTRMQSYFYLNIALMFLLS